MTVLHKAKKALRQDYCLREVLYANNGEIPLEKSDYYQPVADQKAVGFQKQIPAEFVYRIRVLCILGQNQNPAMLP